MGRALLILLTLATFFANGIAILCYARNETTADNGTVLNCSSTGAFCYSYSNYGSKNSIAGCSTNMTCTLPSCVFCTTDYCNSLLPSAISCLTRPADFNATDNDTMTPCATGISTCFTQFSKYYYAGCGNCTAAASLLYGCRQCSSSNCNTQTPSSISCYTRSNGTAASSNGDVTACPTGAAACFAMATGEAACGPCTSTASASYGCLSCNSSNCNTKRRCYFINGYRSDLYLAYRTNVTCSVATRCYQYSTTIGTASFYFSGCNACAAVANSGCSECTTDYCNGFAATAVNTTCYSRTSATDATSDGTTITCSSGVSSCYAKNDGSAGCGSCADASGGCVSCSSSSNCNARRRCLSQSGSLYYYLTSTVTCTSSTSCYRYTSAGTYGTLYYSGCGVCSASNADCQSCTINYCNSFATSSGVAQGLNLRVAAASSALLALFQLL